MVQVQLKLRLNKTQKFELDRWLWHLTGVYNWVIRKIELDAKDGVYWHKYHFINLLAGHSKRLGISSEVLEETAVTAYLSWKRCFRNLSRKPRMKGNNNKLNSIPFRRGVRLLDKNYANICIFGKVKFYKQDIFNGKIKCGRLIKRPSGWYLCLVIDANPNEIPRTGNGKIGIDPGFKHLLTLSTGEKINHPREFEASANRLAQAQKGKNKRLVSRLQEKIKNQRKDRNHKLSRRLVSENEFIAWSKDRHRNIAKIFGKSVQSSAHGQLRQFISYKSQFCGRKFVEVDPKYSTRICSSCGGKTGPAGWANLSVREWECACGASHDRDINAARNTLIFGLGISHERYCKIAPETLDTEGSTPMAWIKN